jgi:hypothetical protein
MKYSKNEVRTPINKLLIGIKCEVNGRKALEISHNGKRDIIFIDDLIPYLFT